MVLHQQWTKYDKSYSTNKLIDRMKFSLRAKYTLLRLEYSTFRLPLNEGHTNVFNIFDGDKSEFLTEYNLYYENFIKLLKSNLRCKFSEQLTEDSDVIFSVEYEKELHEYCKQHKIFYITLI